MIDESVLKALHHVLLEVSSVIVLPGEEVVRGVGI